MPSTQRRSCARETQWVVAGYLTWISSRVPGAIGSTQPSRFNKLKPTIPASYKLSAETSTLWRTPDGPVKLTVHAMVATRFPYHFRLMFAMADVAARRAGAVIVCEFANLTRL